MKITVGKTSQKNLRRIYKCYGVLIVMLLPLVLIVFILDDFIYKILMGMFLLCLAGIFILVNPGLYYLSEIWEVDDQYFRHIVFNSYLEKCRMFYQRDFYPFQLTLKLKNIDYVMITYYCRVHYPYQFLVSDAGYPIVIRFCMIDGSEFIFEKMLNDDRETTMAAFRFMAKQGVRIIDKNKILVAYQKRENLQKYLTAIEKEKEND